MMPAPEFTVSDKAFQSVFSEVIRYKMNDKLIPCLA